MTFGEEAAIQKFEKYEFYSIKNYVTQVFSQKLQTHQTCQPQFKIHAYDIKFIIEK